MADQRHSQDTIEPVDTARAEVLETVPARAPLPDVEGLAHTLSPVDLPAPARPLPHPLRWTVTVIVTACALLLLFNAHSIRGWAYDLKEGPVSQRITTISESWFDLTAATGLDRPAAQLRAWWDAAKAARFPGSAENPDAPVQAGGDTEKGSDAGAPEPSR